MQVANALNLEVFNEYYSIDAVLYEKESDVVNNKAKNETWTNTRGLWLKHIQIAFEHENELYGPTGGYQEICHLLTINSDLKVLVGYAGKDFCDKVAEDFQNIMSNINDTNQSILLILGYLDGDNIQWIGYNLTENSFSRVEKSLFA